jgi:hypothetical protein
MKLSANMSPTDRIIRFIVVIAIIIVLWTELIKGTIATVIGVAGIVLVITSIYGWCPLYTILKISTKKNGKNS